MPPARPSEDQGKPRQGVAPAGASPGYADDPEDKALVGRTLQGEGAAFEALFVKYRQRLMTVAWRLLRDEDAALDVVQESFVKAYERLGSLAGEARFYPWLRRIAINLSIDRLRHERRGVEVGFDEAQFGAGGQAEPPPGVGASGEREERESPVRQAELKEFGRDLQGALEQLSDTHRAVFLLHASEGMSYREIADAVGCNIGTVMSRLFYARKKLQELLAPHLDGVGAEPEKE